MLHLGNTKLTVDPQITENGVGEEERQDRNVLPGEKMRRHLQVFFHLCLNADHLRPACLKPPQLFTRRSERRFERSWR